MAKIKVGDSVYLVIQGKDNDAIKGIDLSISIDDNDPTIIVHVLTETTNIKICDI